MSIWIEGEENVARSRSLYLKCWYNVKSKSLVSRPKLKIKWRNCDESKTWEEVFFRYFFKTEPKYYDSGQNVDILNTVFTMPLKSNLYLRSKTLTVKALPSIQNSQPHKILAERCFRNISKVHVNDSTKC